MANNFQQSPPMEAAVGLKGGLRVQFFRRDPSKFAVDIPKWLEGIDLGRVEHCGICEGPSGHIDLVVFYRPTEDAKAEKAQTLTLLNDTIGLVCDLAEIVKDLQSKLLPEVRPLQPGTRSPDSLAIEPQEAGLGVK